ncbi:MAG: hypothetical protein IPO92_12110 [Saprospiraceae bacterium]|nr:hypothetical protein [Saprospiraceae bacterium]
MRRFNIYWSLLLFLILLSCSNEPMIIESFEIANVDKITEHGGRYVGGRYVTQHYLIKNWRNTKENESKIDSFVCSNLLPEYDTIYAYFITFYKYSDTVNPQYYKDSKKLCEYDMFDARILSYSFSSGLFSKSKGSAHYPLEPFTKFECNK